MDQIELPGLERPAPRHPPALAPEPITAVDLLCSMNISRGYALVILHHGQVTIDGQPVAVDAVLDPDELRGKFITIVGRGSTRLFGLPAA